MGLIQLAPKRILPYIDPLFANVVSLCHFNSTSHLFQPIDQRPQNGWDTATGGSSVDLAAAWRGAGGLDCDSSGYATCSIPGGITLGALDYTLEFVYNPKTILPVNVILLDMRPTSTSGPYPCIYADSSGNLTLLYNASIPITSSGFTFVLNTKYHIRLNRVGGLIDLCIDGVPVSASYNDTSTTPSTANLFLAGSSFAPNTFKSNGYYDEFRFTLGAARMAAGSTYTPPIVEWPDQ